MIIDDNKSEQYNKMKSHAYSQHEQVNSLFKNYQSMNQTLGNDPTKHSLLFRMVAIIIPLQLKLKETLVWQVQYDRETISESLY